MTSARITFLTVCSAGVLAGCSAPPLALEASHPASPSAAEGSAPPARTILHADANSRRTRELLAERDAEAKAAEAEPAIDEKNPSVRERRTSPGPMKQVQGHGEMNGTEGHEHP